MIYSTVIRNTLFSITIAATLMFTACSDQNPRNSTPAQAGINAGSSNQQQELKDAPDFTLDDMEGNPFTLSNHEGKVVVLNIWATWCPPCREEIPDFIAMQQEMRDDGVLFVGAAMDVEGWEVVRPFAEEYAINYPLVVDDGTINQKYGPIQAIPTTFLINKKGKVEYIAPGMVSREILQPALEELANR